MNVRRALLAAILVGVGAPVVAVTAAPAVAGPPAKKVVQLGDSYSAGNGTQAYVPNPNDCYRSDKNWGGQLAASLGATYVNAACSGAVTDNITGTYQLSSSYSTTKNFDPDNLGSTFTQAQYLALAESKNVCVTATTLSDEHYNYSVGSFSFDPNTNGGTATGTIKCAPYMDPQIDAVDKTADVVVLTIGGNDIGFSTIVEQCFFFQSASGCEKAINTAESELPALKTRVLATLEKVRAKMRPDATLIYEGYPYLAPDIPFMLGSYDVDAAVRKLGDEGTAVQKAVVAAMDQNPCDPHTFYSDVAQGVFAGHEINPNKGADNSNAWFVTLFDPGYDVATWYHPIAIGWDNWAKAVISYYDELPTGSTCPTSSAATTTSASTSSSASAIPLANTGTASGSLIGIAVVLVLIGGGLVVVGRSRRRHDH